MAPASAGSAPSVDMFWADVSRTNHSTVTFYLMTNVTIKNIEASDFYVFGSATGCVVDDSFAQSSFHVVTVRGCSDGTVAVQLGANSISDLSMNWGPSQGAASDFTTIDRTGPTFAFDQTLTSVTDPSFTLTASVSEQVQLVDALVAPTVSGEGCSLSGISVAAENYTFAITGCKPGTDAQVTIFANSYKDSIGNLGPAQYVVSQIVKVQSAALPVPTSSPSPTPTSTPQATSSPQASPMPTASPTANATASPTPEVTAAAPTVELPPIDPPQPPAPEAPVLSQEAEPVVPFAPIASIRVIESTEVIEPIAPRAAPKSVAVAKVTRAEFEPEPAREQEPQPELVVSTELARPTTLEVSAPATNLGWVMPAASVISGVFGAVAGALIVRSRLSRKPQLRMA